MGALGVPADNTVAVSGGEITIAGPAGYCVDQSALKDTEESSFVLLASCAAVSRSARQPTPRVAGVLVTSVTGAQGGSPIADSGDLLASFFASEQGRAALSQSGHPDSVKVLETETVNGVFYLHARDSSDGLAKEVRDEYWRALFSIRGHLVSASVFGSKTQPFSSDTGRELLREFVRQIKSANSETL